MQISDVDDEVELEALLKKNPDGIEEGLRVINNQVSTPKGRIDLLCVDSDNVLTIVELKVKIDDDQLKQATNYFDWALENLPWIASIYPKFNIDTTSWPKIILVAPDFTDSVMTGAKYLTWEADIAMYKYLTISHEGKKEVFCSEVMIPEIAEVPSEPRTIEDETNYIKDDNVRKAFVQTLESIKSLGDDIEPRATQSRVVFKYRGRNFANLASKRSFFYVGWKEGSESKKVKVKQFEEAQGFVEEKVKRAYESVGGKQPAQ